MSKRWGFENERAVHSRSGKSKAIILSVGAVVTVGLMLAAVASSHREPVSQASNQMPEREPRLRTSIIAGFIGDSWTGGSEMGGNAKNNWSFLVAEHYGWAGVPLAAGGAGYVAGGGQDLQFGSNVRIFDIASRRPDILLITNGVNDLDVLPESQEYRLDEIRVEADRAFQLLSAEVPRSKIVVIGYIPPGGSNAWYVSANSVLSEVSDAHGIMFIDPTSLDLFSGENQRLIGTDKFHLTDEGHSYFADQMILQLNAFGASGWPQVYANWTIAENP